MIISARKDKIVDKVNLNNFGVLFHTMKSMELFQEKSGMKARIQMNINITIGVP